VRQALCVTELFEQVYVETAMWDPKDRLQADMQYAIRMVQTRYATVEQAAVMCGLELDALQEQLTRLTLRTQLAGSEKPAHAPHRYVPGAY
jgi:uncharacterized protein (DUF2461 family)